MTKILILGANGQLARHATRCLLQHDDMHLTLYLPTFRDYRLTHKGEPFRGHDVSLNGLSNLIVKLALTPGMELRQSLGVSQA